MNIKLTAHVNLSLSIITITPDSRLKMPSEFFDTKERLLRQGLIAMGWTPPPGEGKSSGLTAPPKPLLKKTKQVTPRSCGHVGIGLCPDCQAFYGKGVKQ